jgi:hypothetical protein
MIGWFFLGVIDLFKGFLDKLALITGTYCLVDNYFETLDVLLSNEFGLFYVLALIIV